MSVVLRYAALLLAVTVGLWGCTDEGAYEGNSADRADLRFASSVEVGDIILTNSQGAGCWYLSGFQNAFTGFRYCHAALVIERTGANGITTIEAASPTVNVDIFEDRQEELSAYTGPGTNIVVLRVLDEDGNKLSPEMIDQVIARSKEFLSASYVPPPIDIDGDPNETGIYCSMLPYRAYFDATGIDLDGFFPGIITPDELYKSRRTMLVYESSPPEPNEPWPDPDEDF